MATEIMRVGVENTNFVQWGVEINDYSLDNVRKDFQDIMVTICSGRATAVESEIAPMSTRMRKRNDELNKLGQALSALNETQAKYSTDGGGDEAKDLVLSEAAAEGMTYATGTNWTRGTYGGYKKSSCDRDTQLVKTATDKRNNESQTDMTRLQSLVDKRDESYSTATSLMQAIGDTRSSAIRNM